MNTKSKRLLVAGIAAAVVLIAVIAVVLVNATKQPSTADYKSLDIQRQVVDTSMNVYGPVFGEFSTDYANVFAEQRSSDETTALKTQYVDTLEQERKVNADRLKRMESSVALKEPAVKESFENFSNKYGAIISYYEQHTKNIAGINESVGGPCAFLSKLNVAAASFDADYIKAADACLTALSEAKKVTDDATDATLSKYEVLFKERRDKFKEVVDADEAFYENVARLEAILLLLDINRENKAIIAAYETTTRTDYTKLVNEANDANAAFDAALKPLLATSKQGEA